MGRNAESYGHRHLSLLPNPHINVSFHVSKGSPAPKWLEDGIPYIERDEEKRNFNAPAKSETEPIAAATQ